MVQIIDDPYSGNVFGRIGKGIGKGLSEQLPKEIERSRLSAGLKKFEQESQGLTPLQQFTRLASIPGMTTEHLHTIRPLLEQQRKRAGFEQRLGGKLPTKEKGLAGGPTVPKMGDISEKPSGVSGERTSLLASPSEISDYKSSLQATPDKHDIDLVAQDILDSGMTQDVDEARNYALKELNQNIQSQQINNKAFRDDFQNRFARELQTRADDPGFNQVVGEMQQALIDQGEYLINKKGLTPEQASLEMSNIAKELGKTITKTRETASNLMRPSKAKTFDLREQKAEFEKYGFGDLFNDIAAAEMGITPLQAAHELSPIKNHNYKEKIDLIPKQITGEVKEIPVKKLDEVIRAITPKDNLLSVAYDIRAKGGDVNQFKRRVRELVDAGQIALSPEQIRQMKTPISESFYGDIFYQIF